MGVLLVVVVDELELATAAVDDDVVDFLLFNGIGAVCAATAANDSVVD